MFNRERVEFEEGTASSVRVASWFFTNTYVRLFALIAVLALVFIPSAIPFRIVLVAVLSCVWIFCEAGTLAPMGLGRQSLLSTFAWAVGLATTVLLLGEVMQPAIEWLLGIQTDYSGYGALAGNADAAMRLLGYALISAAIGEELLFRGFLLHQLTAVLGSGTRARWTSLAIGALIFGLAHYVQGPSGMLSTGVIGFIFGWAWFRSDRNLWAVMLAHALVDTCGIAMLYFGRYT